MSGTPIGLSHLYYALLTKDDVSGVAYSVPERVTGAISININPNSSTEVQFADNGPMDTASALGMIEVELSAADVPQEVQAVWLGHSIVGGVMIRKGSDVPAWVAIGFKALKSNGMHRFVWLAKGKFALPEEKHETKGDKVNFQPPTLKGSFVRRDFDEEWERRIDEDSVDYVPATGANWFSSVGGSSDTTAPTLSSITPLNNAVDVAVNSTVVWQFNEAILASVVTNATFMVVKDSDGSPVAGALSYNSAHTQVTFTPTAALGNSTKYIAIATTGVKNLAGLPMAAVSVTDFTTVA